MTYSATDPITEDGYTWADVYADGQHIGRLVHVEPSDTWRPDARLAHNATWTAGRRWQTLAAFRDEIQQE